MRLNLLISLSDRLCESTRGINRKIRGYKAHKWLWFLIASMILQHMHFGQLLLEGCSIASLLIQQEMAASHWGRSKQHSMFLLRNPHVISKPNHRRRYDYFISTESMSTVSYKHYIMHIITPKSTSPCWSTQQWELKWNSFIHVCNLYNTAI